MNNIGFLLALLLSPCVARAIKPPSATEHAAIQALIDQANEINKTSNPNLRDLVTAKADLDSEERKPEYLQNHANVDRLRTEVKTLKTTRDKLYQQAIQKTLLAYDLVGRDANGKVIMPTKPAVHPSVKGRDAHWIVVYKDDEDRVLLDKSGDAQTIPAARKSVGGITGVDGVTTMFGKLYSTADLALLLYHERVHYEQFTTPGVGDKLIYDEREEKAYQSEYDKLGEFGLTPNELTTFRKFLMGDPATGAPGKIREHREKGRIERRKLTVSLGYWGGAEPASVQPRSRSEYNAMLEESKDFDSQLAAAAEAAKELVAAQKREQDRIAHRDHDDRLAAAILELTNRSCDTPGSVTQAELDALPSPYSTDFIDRIAYPLDQRECFKVYFYLGKGGRDASEVAQQATPRLVPIVVRPIQQPADGRIRPSPFTQTFPDLARFCVDSCRQPGSASPVLMNWYQRPYSEFFGNRVNWESWYQRELAGLDGCPRQLFIDLVNMALEGTYGRVGERGWLEAQVARHSPTQGGVGSGSPPSRGGDKERKGPDHDDVRRRLGGVFKPR